MMLNVDRIQFRDVLDFTAPTNLDKYLKTWNASEVKSIFPYSHFKSIEELESLSASIALDLLDKLLTFDEDEIFFVRVERDERACWSC